MAGKRKDGYLTAGTVAQRLDISTGTLNSWYKWQENYKDPDIHRNIPTLPEYLQESSRGIRLWRPEAISKLKAFQKALPRGRGGIMGQYNARFWGERGKRALENKK